MKLKKVLKAANQQIGGGSDYGWPCYSVNARWLDFTNKDGTEIGNCVYDAKTQRVFEVMAYDDEVGTHYTWRDDRFVSAYEDEAKKRGIDPYNAYDDKQTTLVNKDTLLAILKSYATTVSNDANHASFTDGLSPNIEWPFPTHRSDEDSSSWSDYADSTPKGKEDDDVTDEEIEAAFPGATMKNKYDVQLVVKCTFEVKADSMEEAAEIAANWYTSNKSTETWPEGLVWMDRWVSKKKVTVNED